MRRFALLLSLLAGPVSADEWVPMSGDEIRMALTGRVLVYPDTTQEFRASGRTLYTCKGRESWGYWRIEDDRYCSQWPPNDMWACYGMDRNGDAVRFVGESGDITEATYAD